MRGILLFYLLFGIASFYPKANGQWRLRIGGWGCSMVSAALVIGSVSNGGRNFTLLQAPFWPLGSLTFAGDSLSWIFTALIGLLGAAAGWYSVGYIGSPSAAGALKNYLLSLQMLLLNGFMLSMCLVVLSGSAFAFMMAWELMAVFSYLLVVIGNPSTEARQAGFVYITMTHIGAAFLTAAFILLYSATGSFAFSHWMEHSSEIPPVVKGVSFLLFLIGFGVKGGLVPFHVWLPRAHPAAPGHVSALMSGVMVKTAVYGYIRFILVILGVQQQHWWGILVVGLGLFSAVTGILNAQVQHDIKRLLAYSTIENIGLIFVALGLATTGMAYGYGAVAGMAMGAALLHTICHGVFKGLLFLSAGSVQHGSGTKDLALLGGLNRRMPSTSVTMLAGALSACAIPAFGGFVSEWLLLKSSFGLFVSGGPVLARLLGFCTATILALTGGMAVAAFVRLYGTAFLGLSRSREASSAHESPVSMLAPMYFLALLSVLFGLAPRLPMGFVSYASGLCGVSPLSYAGWGGQTAFALVLPLVLASAAWLFSSKANRQEYGVSETWNCGYPLEPQMQYSSAGFSQPFQRMWSIRPWFDRLVYAPVRNCVLHGANRIKTLQSGRLQTYVVYIFATVVILIAVAR